MPRRHRRRAAQGGSEPPVAEGQPAHAEGPQPGHGAEGWHPELPGAAAQPGANGHRGTAQEVSENVRQ